MNTPAILIITGLPCSGKTTLGKRLAADLHLPYYYKDGFKELLFERLGWKDRAWSHLLSLASYDVMFHVLEAELRAGRSLMVESNFSPALDTPRFQALLHEHPFAPIQLLCRAPGDMLVQRYQRRVELAERHPGHLDHLLVDELRPSLQNAALEPLDLPGARLEIDTSSPQAVDYDGLLKMLKGLVPDFM